MMNRRLVFTIAALAAMTTMVAAQVIVPSTNVPGDTKVVFQVATWIDVAFDIIKLALGAATTAVMLIVPFWARPIIYTWHLDKIIQDAAAAALLKAKEKLKHQLGPNGEITIDVKNVAVADTIQMVEASVSAWLISIGGGKGLLAIKAMAWIEKLITSKATTYVEAPVVVVPVTAPAGRRG